MSEKNLQNLRITVYVMILLSIVTFMSGFLKYTPFEHITLLLIFLLAIGGIKLFYRAKKTVHSGYTKFFLILIGISAVIFMVSKAIASAMTLFIEVSLSDILELLEGWFYLVSLLFLFGIIGRIIFSNINQSHNSTQL